MILTELKIHCLRNILSAHLVLNPRFNFIAGPNGSGKTSILEALYLLSCGHSFRSREIAPIISKQHTMLTVFAKARNEETISIQKSSSNPTQIKLNNQFCSSTSQVAYALPCQVIYSDVFQIIDAGAAVRRSLLDWGLFHVKHNYLGVWKEYKKVLKQRNALLKTHAAYNQFVPWDKQLSKLANEIHILRHEYFGQWVDSFEKVLDKLSDISCSISYYKGWDRKKSGKSLDAILADSFVTDNHKQYTQYGPHQADIHIESNDTKAKNILSRGQQKIILMALKFAQADLLDKECLYLIDDLAAELDEAHQCSVLNYLAESKGQYIITSTSLVDADSIITPDQISQFLIQKGQVV